MKPPITIAALYKFFVFPDREQMQASFQALCAKQGVRGTVLMAEEGINGTIAGTASGIETVLAFLKADPRMTNLDVKFSYADEIPFKRLKIKLKNELISLGDPSVDPNEQVGTYIDPQDWNALISDPDVRLVDTRNDFEVEIGTFKGAEDPDTFAFRDFPEWVAQNLDPQKDKKVAMFCTGGIRCEKASSYLLREGFEEVYHLKGGILKYLEEVPEDKSMWEGECFVFDERVSVVHGLDTGSYDACCGCGRPLSDDDRHHPKFEEGVTCPRCHDLLTDHQIAGFRERQRQIELAKQRQVQHLGPS